VRPSVEHPTVEHKRIAGSDGTVEQHPAYALIGASRVTGRTVLFGSDFWHNNFVAIRVMRCEMNRSLSHDWPFGRDEVVEVWLSEAQWATFVSSLNCGQGVPCTLHAEGGRTVAGLPEPVNRQEQFNSELEAHMADVRQLSVELSTRIEASTLRVKEKTELQGLLARLIQQAGTNTRFVARSFGEHVERTVERAKVEVSAWVHALVTRTGLAALGARPPIELGDGHGEEARDEGHE
jgi:hypothetical protein